MVFSSQSENGKVPEVCKTASSIPASARCNVMTGDEFRSSWTQSNFHSSTGCYSGAPSNRQRWCPAHRDSVQLTADYYGIWISFRHDNHFNLVGSESTVTRQTVMRLEPKGVEP